MILKQLSLTILQTILRTKIQTHLDLVHPHKVYLAFSTL